jgi:hypothetical protein
MSPERSWGLISTSVREAWRRTRQFSDLLLGSLPRTRYLFARLFEGAKKPCIVGCVLDRGREKFPWVTEVTKSGQNDRPREPSMETFINIFDCIFGCHHRRLSRVFTSAAGPIGFAERRSNIPSRVCQSSAGLGYGMTPGTRTQGRNTLCYDGRGRAAGGPTRGGYWYTVVDASGAQMCRSDR